MKKISIAIDGPAGAGKSTVARMLAQRLGYVYLDTGALYRTIAIAAKEAGIASDDAAGLKALCARSKIRLVREGHIEYVELNGRKVGNEIRTPEIGRLSSDVSKIPEVRAALLNLQRGLAKEGGVVMEGRDIGTVVLPNAELKFFLSASVDERARRRWKELQERGEKVPLQQIKEEVLKRDKQDSERAISPLKKSKEAIEIDTTNHSVDEIVTKMYGIAKEKEGKHA